MPNNSGFKRGFKTKAEELAIYYREKLRLSPFKPLCAFKLASYMEIPVFSVEDAFQGNELNPHFALMNDTSKFNALWMPNEDGDKIIIHNQNHSSQRQQSNLMHELSHIILEHSIPEDIGKICHKFNLHYYSKQHELEARFLGACLQITTPSIRWVIKEKWTEDEISHYYNASLEMVRYRINILNRKRNHSR